MTLLVGTQRLSSDICCRLQNAASIQGHLPPAVPILAETPFHIIVLMSGWVLPPGSSDASSERRRCFILLWAPKPESLMITSFWVVSEPYLRATTVFRVLGFRVPVHRPMLHLNARFTISIHASCSAQHTSALQSCLT